MQYSCGFLMTWDLNDVVLIKNTKGYGQGKWNAVGGKIERIFPHEHTGSRDPLDNLPFESLKQCIVREFHEETGVHIPDKSWICYDVKQFKNGNKVYFFVAFSDRTKIFPTFDDLNPMFIEGNQLARFNQIDIHWEDPNIFTWDVKAHLYNIYSLMKTNHIREIDPEGINSAT